MAIRWTIGKIAFSPFPSTLILMIRFSLFKVGPLTNLTHTQCLSTHLTTFAGGFLVLPESVNWNYVFANAICNRNKTVYLTVTCAAMLYIALLMYVRINDKRDGQRVRESHLCFESRGTDLSTYRWEYQP